MKKTYMLSILLFSLTLSLPLYAQDKLVDISKFYPEEIRIAGFTLDSDQNVSVKATAIVPRRNYRNFNFSYAWILNSDSRDLVWEMSNAEIEDRDRYLVTYEGDIELKQGTYEVYYSTYPYFNFEDDFYYHWGARGFFSGIFNAIFDEDDDDRYQVFDDLYDQLYFTLEGSGAPLSDEEINERQNALKERAFITFTELRDDEFEEQVFKVIRPVNLNVYALGEARRDGEYDFGAIINLKTRERIWRLDYRHSDAAGGATKNRVNREVIQLEPGMYKALYVTDDSHSYRRWNSAPPFDPAFWGLTIWAENAGDTQALTKLDTEEEYKQATIVEFNKVRDNEYLSEGFTLKNGLNLHIYALGEGRDGDMFDYGWIIDAKTREKVWEMDYYDTEPAGGGSKNRIFDGIINLKPGNYIVYYITDDSHAYRSWNTDPPYDKKHWGITVSVLDDNYEEGDFSTYVPEKDPAILAQLVRIRDDERRKSKFSLSTDGYVQVYAVGEGSDGEMYDYAWIEDANTGRVVWEMTYRKTERAGGAKKNRQFNDRVYLEAGDYVVYYESDDSHSFNDWNARPPRDPFNYGVTISKVDD